MISSISNKWLALIVVLVAGLGLSVGYILIPYLESSQTAPALVSTNNSNIVNNNSVPISNTSTQNNVTNKPNNGLFNGNYSANAASAADNIALNWVKTHDDPQGLPVTIDNPNRPGGPTDFETHGPNEMVYMVGIDVGNQIHYVEVSASNGKVVADNGQNK